MKIERKSDKCQTVNKTVLFWARAAILSGDAPKIHRHLHNTHTPPKLCKNIDLYVHYDHQQDLGTGHFNNLIVFNICKTESFMSSVAKHEIIYELGKIQ